MSIFISYSSQDKELVNNICASFDANGIAYWVAHKDIKSGENFANAIMDAIDRASIVLVFISPASNNSRYVQRELEVAVTKGKTLLPVIVGDVELSASMQFFLSISQVMPYSNSQAFSDTLIARIRELLGHQAPNPSQPAATPSFHGERYHPNSGKNAWKILICVLLAALLITGISIGVALLQDDSPTENNGSSNQSQSQNNTHSSDKDTQATKPTNDTLQSPSTESTTPSSEPSTESTVPSSAPSGENQVPEKYNAQIEAHKHLDASAAQATTHIISVGEEFTPSLLSIWPNCTIYSQNTAIATATGIVITGVSPGDTYMVAVTPTGSFMVFHIVVIQ